MCISESFVTSGDEEPLHMRVNDVSRSRGSQLSRGPSSGAVDSRGTSLCCAAVLHGVRCSQHRWLSSPGARSTSLVATTKNVTGHCPGPPGWEWADGSPPAELGSRSDGAAEHSVVCKGSSPGRARSCAWSGSGVPRGSPVLPEPAALFCRPSGAEWGLRALQV